MVDERPVKCDPAEPWDEVPPELADIFVVQRHEASTLHWDLRLSMDGLPKGSPLLICSQLWSGALV